MFTTVPELLAYALEKESPSGSHRCYFCGGRCAERFRVEEYLQETFTDLAYVACPGSSWVCRGCTIALQSAGTVTMLDGARRTFELGGFRAYSWVISTEGAWACSPALRNLLAETCLRPPPPPSAIVVTTSGQKHLLYRGVVNHGGDVYTLTLDGEPIRYSPAELQERLALCSRLVRVLGRGTTQDWKAGSILRKSAELDPSDLESWEELRHEPISRLCLWLVPGEEKADRLP